MSVILADRDEPGFEGYHEARCLSLWPNFAGDCQRKGYRPFGKSEVRLIQVIEHRRMIVYWLLVLILGPMALMCLGGALVGTWQRLALLTRGSTTEAVILGLKDEEVVFADEYFDPEQQEYSLEARKTLREIRIRFQDQEGRTHTLRYPSGSQAKRRFSLTSSGVSGKYRIGDRVTVRYLSDDPKFCFIEGSTETWGPVIASSVWGSLILGILVLFWFVLHYR